MSNPESTDETALQLFGQRVRSLREQQGFSLRGFAKHTGINRSHLSDIELGRVGVTLDTLLYLAYVLDVNASELLQPLDERRELYLKSKDNTS